MNKSIKIDEGKSLIKRNHLRLIGAVIAGIISVILLFLGTTILAHYLFGINQSSEIGLIGYILYCLSIIAIGGYVSYRLTDELNKSKTKGTTIGILSGIIIFFIIFSVGSFLRRLMEIPYTDNYFNSQNLMFISQIISAIIGGFISYRIGKSNISGIITAVLVAGLSFLILAMIAF